MAVAALTRLLLCVCVLLTLSCLPALPSGFQRNSTYDLGRVTELVQAAVDTLHLTGASLLLVKDGSTIYEQSFGAYNRDTVVPIASGTKLLSACVIMTLVDEGRLALDDPVSRYLPEFTDGKGKITLRQLLSHTSGLVDNHPSLGDDSMTLEEFVRRIARLNLASEPGSTFHYGNLSFAVAGRVAEVASGKPWATLFEEKIKGPLHMEATTYGDTQNPVIGGGARTTLHDYGNLLQMLLDQGTFAGSQVLSPGSVREMQRDQTFGAPIVVSVHSDQRRYGLGQWLDAVDEEGNATQVSSQGDTGFSPWIDLRRRLVGVFLVDDSLGNVYQVVEKVQQAVREAIDSSTAGPAASQPSWDTWLGVWLQPPPSQANVPAPTQVSPVPLPVRSP